MSLDFDFLHLLRAHGVPFVVIGGHAVNYHGHRRATEDTDVVWRRSPAAEQNLHAALTVADAQYITREIDPATGIERTRPVTPEFIKANHLMMLWTRFGFVDLFDYVPGHPAADVQNLFDTGEEDDGLLYPSLDWLRRMKVAAGRSKDLIDLEQLPPAET